MTKTIVFLRQEEAGPYTITSGEVVYKTRHHLLVRWWKNDKKVYSLCDRDDTELAYYELAICPMWRNALKIWNEVKHEHV